MLIKRLNDILFSKAFLVISCLAIFLLSIFLRSMINIGADTGIYLDLGKKVAQGGKYYYDFFESNFPLSFYFYALEFHISNFLHINPIITSEIVINILAVFSIFWSGKILQNTTIYDNKAHYNLIIIAYVLGFFLRIGALQIGEFGTKTSLLLICLYPYISLSFERKNPFSKFDIVLRGALMGVIGCLKPHYLIFIIFIEFHKFWQKKSLRFFLELDKLIMILIGLSYLILMIKFTPEFFEFMVPMWSKVYNPYDNREVFLDNLFHRLAVNAAIYSFVFLIFSRLKLSANDKILTLLFVSSSLLLILENLGTIDQEVVFYAIATICVLKFTYDLINSGKVSFKDNKFIILSLAILPIFDLDNLPWLIFSASGFINIWWFIALVLPAIFIVKVRKDKPVKWQEFKFQNSLTKILSKFYGGYILLLISTLLALKYFGVWAFIAVNLFSLFIALFCFEILRSKFYKTFSAFFVFVIGVTISFLFYSYVQGVATFFNKNHFFQSPNQATDQISYYSQIYAPKRDDGILIFSTLDSYQFPLINYLGKKNHYEASFTLVDARYGGNGKMFSETKDFDKAFVFAHFMEELKNQMRTEDIKVIFVSNREYRLITRDKCFIGFLEYYFQDQEFKKIFFKNFRYESRILVAQKNNKEKPSTQKVIYDFDVYVRR